MCPLKAYFPNRLARLLENRLALITYFRMREAGSINNFAHTRLVFILSLWLTDLSQSLCWELSTLISWLGTAAHVLIGIAIFFLSVIPNYANCVIAIKRKIYTRHKLNISKRKGQYTMLGFMSSTCFVFKPIAYYCKVSIIMSYYIFNAKKIDNHGFCRRNKHHGKSRQPQIVCLLAINKWKCLTHYDYAMLFI